LNGTGPSSATKTFIDFTSRSIDLSAPSATKDADMNVKRAMVPAPFKPVRTKRITD